MYESGDEELEALRPLLKSGKLFRYQGKDVETECLCFEKEFSFYMGTNKALLLSSGTNALLCALKASGIGEGDEVLIPGFTFVATAAAVLQAGAKPVLVNIDENLSISVPDILKKISPRTRAIIPVHMDGLNCDMKKIVEIAQERSLIIIEDVAQAVGGSFQGKKLGTFGEAGCFSFNVDKIISCGEGGALICHDPELFKKALAYHDVAARFGMTFRDTLSEVPMDEGISMRVSEISGALMRVQLKRLNRILSSLRERKSIFAEAFRKEGFSFIAAHDPEGDCNTSFLFHARDPMAAHGLCKRLLPYGIKAIPSTGRPAHAFWQWIDVLKLSDEEKKQVTSELMPTKLLLSSLVKIFIDPGKSLNETKVMAEKLVKEIKCA